MAWHVVCGNGELITIIDYGNGSCSATVQQLDWTSKDKPCEQLLFDKPCGSLNGSLTLLAQNNAVGAYNGPHWNQWLTLMGLNAINIVGFDLKIELRHSAGGEIPPPVTPKFLPQLQAVARDLSAVEDGIDLDISQIPRALTSVPGFLSILYVQGSIDFEFTGLRDLSGTLRPRCPPTNSISFSDNPNLVSLAGFQQMQTALPNTDPSCGCTLPDVDMRNNIKLRDLTSLYTFAGCPIPSPEGPAYIELDRCPFTPLQSYSDICTYIVLDQCPGL